MIWALIKVIANVLWFLFLTTLAAALIWAIYSGFKSDGEEKELCARLRGELINLSGPVECVKKVVRYTDEEKSNAPR